MLDTLPKTMSRPRFCGRQWVKDNEETLKKIYAAGHEIANHGFFHKDQKKLDYARNREEIEVTHKLVESILGIKMGSVRAAVRVVRRHDDTGGRGSRVQDDYVVARHH